MSEEIEDIAEISIELAKESAENHAGPRWVNHSAISSMVMAMFLAITALFAGLSANDSLINRLIVNADLIKANTDILEREILINRDAILKGQDVSVMLINEKKEGQLEAQATEMLSRTPEEVNISNEFLHAHEIFALGATVLSIAISMTGMAIAIRRKKLWHFALVFALIGLVIISNGFLRYFYIE